MAIPSSYFTSTKNLAAILEQIQKAGVPPKFTYEHLKQLGFPSSNDRPVIPVLKSIGFLDANGVPQERYRRFKNPAEARRVMAEGVREAYSDVFGLDEAAEKLPHDDLKGVFARLSGKSETVSEKMAKTFRALADQADFSAPARGENGTGDGDAGEEDRGAEDEERRLAAERLAREGRTLTLRHDVHVHLPASENIEVYDAIFRSLRENLLA